MKTLSVLVTVLLISNVFAVSRIEFHQSKLNPAKTILSKSISPIEKSVEFNLKNLFAKEWSKKQGHFEFIEQKNINYTSEVGAPRIPFQSVIIAGNVNDIKVELDEGEPTTLKNFLPSASGEELCRCDDEGNKKKLEITNFKKEAFENAPLVTIEYLGDFRGTPYSKVTVRAAQTDLATEQTTFFPQLRANIFSNYQGQIQEINSNVRSTGFDYLIITPSEFIDVVQGFVEHKSAKESLTFSVVKYEDLISGSTSQDQKIKLIQKYIKEEYKKNNFKYSLIIGTESLVPNFRVRTSGSSKTPSDLPYYTFGGMNDFIPDVYYGRVVAKNKEEVRRQFAKWKRFEDGYENSIGYNRGITIASREGSNPSDNEYTEMIREAFTDEYGMSFTHFYETNTDSNPENLNKAFNEGASWLTYIGHGSGTSWPSMYKTYSVSHISKMMNTDSVKPIFIDVACANGKLAPGYSGERLMNQTNKAGDSLGSTAYYGGSVNISWHPPAIMAKGMAIKAAEGLYETVGELILAGQLYLNENYSNTISVQDNFEWYHLFGDPSMRVRFTK